MNLEIIEKTPTICLNMIVKNESKIIERLLESVLPIIDTYCICDTGSTDNTKTIIKEFFNKHNIFGKILDYDFINFEENRNYALKEAKDMASYILLLDADMILNIDKNFKKSQLIDPVYNICQGNDVFRYFNIRLLANSVNAKYSGVTHEYIDILDNSYKKNCEYLKILDLDDGGSKSNKFERDISLLKKGLENNSNNIRYNFYLANTLLDCNKYEEALEYYKKHAEIVTWNEEHFYNYYKQGICYKHLNNEDKMIESWMKAWTIRPTRVESLFEIIQYYRNKCIWDKCKIYYDIAKNIKFPKDDILFVHKDIYDHKLLHEYSIFAYYIGERNIFREFTFLMNTGNYDQYYLFNNYKFYYPLLNNIKKTIDLNHEFMREINNENYRFRASTPSIINLNNTYGINIRYVNYNIQANGTYDWVKNIISINKFLTYDKEFNKLQVKEMNYDYKNRQYEGIEDIKIINNNNDIKFIGNKLKINNNIGICIGHYDISNCNIIYNELSKENEESCEKNWVFIPKTDKIIYKWYPLEIYDISNNYLINQKIQSMPHIFKMARGSTNGFLYKDEIWFIVHFVHQIDNEPRFYYHMFVKFNKDMTKVTNSVPFKLTNEPIEYCCGIVIEETQIIITHSIWDRESYIKVFDKTYIETFFVKY
tara:strand:+ start:1950 stop:3905 length:1956 start_codon:yes stop_codon:yes gene_type:complete